MNKGFGIFLATLLIGAVVVAYALVQGMLESAIVSTTQTAEATLVVSPTVESHTTSTGEVTRPTTEVTRLVCVLTGVPQGYLNLRTEAGTEYAVMKVLAEGESLEFSGEEKDGWLRVKLSDNRQGWVYSKYIGDC